MYIKNNILHVALLMATVFSLVVFCLSCGKKADPHCSYISYPAAVSDLNAIIKGGKIKLGWTVKGKDTDGLRLRILRSELKAEGDDCSGCPRRYFLIAKLSFRDPKLRWTGENQATYIDAGVRGGYLYSYKILICNASGVCSDESNVAEMKFP